MDSPYYHLTHAHVYPTPIPHRQPSHPRTAASRACTHQCSRCPHTAASTNPLPMLTNTQIYARTAEHGESSWQRRIPGGVGYVSEGGRAISDRNGAANHRLLPTQP